ncbi:MAG: glycine zipper 2TM domain-containing protein [Burkholderiaceae bacterium]|nr:MAG: glycine zipper 2TM domain-containing protein [Burkholderiaceae bacterium]
MRTLHTSFLLSGLMLGLAACTWQSHSGSSYNARETQREQTVRMATVESVREVMIDRQQTGVGTGAGAVVGGVAGSNVGKGKGAVVGTVLGAVVGGIAGHAIEGEAAKVKGFEITVKLDNGELRAIVQEADEVFHPGERVRLLSSGGTTRVSH